MRSSVTRLPVKRVSAVRGWEPVARAMEGPPGSAAGGRGLTAVVPDPVVFHSLPAPARRVAAPIPAGPVPQYDVGHTQSGVAHGATIERAVGWGRKSSADVPPRTPSATAAPHPW